MKRSDLYTIGEVCRICNVNPSMMRYYDEIGLIKPYTFDEETGYRYYSGEVLLELPVLYYLKNLGFSLKEIKKALESIGGKGAGDFSAWSSSKYEILA